VDAKVVSASLAGLGFVVGLERVRHFRDGWNPSGGVGRPFVVKALPGWLYVLTMRPMHVLLGGNPLFKHNFESQ
jgi:hypothetical protein